MTEPISDALTRSIRPSRSAKMVMISSAALPSVALIRPPAVGPSLAASASVACPMSDASGMIARLDVTNTTIGSQPDVRAMSATGTKISSKLRLRRLDRRKPVPPGPLDEVVWVHVLPYPPGKCWIACRLF